MHQGPDRVARQQRGVAVVDGVSAVAAEGAVQGAQRAVLLLGQLGGREVELRDG